MKPLELAILLGQKRNLTKKLNKSGQAMLGEEIKRKSKDS